MRLARVTAGTRVVTAVDAGDGVWRATETTVLDAIAGAPYETLGEVRVDPTTLLAPLRPPTVIGIGLNYRDTVEEMGWAMPTKPYLFPKLSSSVTGPYAPVVIDPSVTTRADWEGELGVVIGETTRDVAESDALAHVFGYVTANDVSARDIQAEDGQWLRGKGLDTFCPLGPWITTAEEVPDPQRVPIRTWHNGRLAATQPDPRSARRDRLTPWPPIALIA